MKYYEIESLNDKEKQEFIDRGLYVYDLRSNDAGGEIATIEKSVLVNRVGSIITNEEIPLGDKETDNFKDYQEFINENAVAISIDDFFSDGNFQYYEINEIKNILKSKERLVIVDDGANELMIRYKEIPDFIVDVNERIGMVDLNFYDYHNPSMTPLLSTYGEFLNKCNPEVRKDIIDRLVKLQLGEENIKPYKVMDEYTILTAKEEMKKDKKKLKER